MKTRQGAWAVLLGLESFLALTAVAGGIGLLLGWIRPGLEQLSGSPFSDYTIPGVVLLVVVGGSAAAATILLAARHDLGAPVAGWAGLMIVGYEIVELTTVEFHWLQIFYLGIGLLQLGLGTWVWMRLIVAPSAADASGAGPRAVGRSGVWETGAEERPAIAWEDEVPVAVEQAAGAPAGPLAEPALSQLMHARMIGDVGERRGQIHGEREEA